MSRRGPWTRPELHEILRRLSRARAERIKAGSHARIARVRLARLTGETQEGLAVESLAVLVTAVPVSLEVALERVERESPLLAEARAGVEAAEGDLVFHKADLWPSLALEVSAGSGRVVDVGTLEVRGGVQLAMALYEGGRKRSRLRGARSALGTAKQDLIAERERAEVQVRSELGPDREPGPRPEGF